MDTDSSLRLVYLVLLGCVVGSVFFVSARRHIGRTLQQAGIWFLLFVGAVLAYGIWEDVAQIAVPRQAVVSGVEGVVVEVPRARDGHYHLLLDVNGSPIEFIVDTGATDLVLTRADAARAGISEADLRYTGEALTANGTVRTAAVTLERVALGALVDRDVRAVVNEGAMHQSLLGMSYLQSFGRIEIEGDRLRLIR